MGFLNDFINKFFGNKSQRDIKEILPILELTKATYEKVKLLSNDELRNASDELKKTSEILILTNNRK